MNFIIMLMGRSNRYDMILFEKMSHDLEIVVEAVGSIQDYMRTLATKDELSAVARRVENIEYVVTETNREIRLHDKRITNLERKVFN